MPSGVRYEFYVTVDGRRINADLARDLEQVVVESSLHLPDVATLIFQDQRLRWIDDQSLLPGKALKIEAGLGGQAPVLVFDGEIVEIEPEFRDATQRLVMRAFDRLHRLARGCHVRTFQNVTDADLVQQLVSEVGLSASIDATSQVHEYVLQANETNLAFLQRRAAMLGFLLYADGTRIHCRAPEDHSDAYELLWGDQGTLIDFRPRLSTIDQVVSVNVRGWDPNQKREVLGRVNSANGVTRINVQNTGGSFAETAFNVSANTLVADRPVRTQAEADQLARAEMGRHDSRFVEAAGTCAGEPKIVAGAKVNIRGVGERFSGTYLVTSATHTYGVGDSNYEVAFMVSGLNPSTLLNMIAPPPAVQHDPGLTIGLVTDNQDPIGQGRVKLIFPWLSADHGSTWARIVAPGAGKNRGIQFMPEVNDEVLVGFEQGDMQHPYVIGGLWNGKDAPPLNTSDSTVINGSNVQRRVIRSRAGHEILIDDDSSGGLSILVTGSKQYSIKLSLGDDAITIDSAGDIKLVAQKNIQLEAATGEIVLKARAIKLEAQTDLGFKGTSAKLEAQTTMDIKATGMMSINATGILELKGSLIKLN